MTIANKKENIREEIQRGDEAFDSARLLLSAGHLLDAMSRTYYAVFHYLKALLLSKGLEPKSHHAAIHLFSQFFVKEGIFDSSLNRILSAMQKFREEADYNPSWVISEEGVKEEMEKAALFRKKTLYYLRRKKLFKGS